MKTRKSFAQDVWNDTKTNEPVAEAFISKKSKGEKMKDISDDLEEIQKPMKETKNMALHLTLKPSTYKGIQKLSEDKKISKNETVNQILDIYIKKYIGA
jgi:DNA-directed RNA polymerase subunit F